MQGNRDRSLSVIGVDFRKILGLCLWAALAAAVVAEPRASAKDLSHRLGVGYADQWGLDQSLPSLAVRYYPNQEYGVMGALGVDTRKGGSAFGFQGKIMKIVFREDNLNFYTGAAGSVVSQQTTGSTSSGFDISGFIGAEFFFPGLENLGFNMEAGVGVTSVSSEVRFRTIGDHPLRAGIFFYF